MDFKKKKKSLTLWPSKIGHVHLSGTAANSHQVPESWVCNWFKCSCSSEHGLILEANTKTMWVESAGHPCNLTNPRPVRKIHIHMLAHNARNSTESRKQPFGGSPLVSPCPHHSSLSCDFSSGSFVLLVLFLFNIRKEQVCSVQWSDPESRFPVQPYHSFAPLIGQQPQSLTIVIRRLCGWVNFTNSTSFRRGWGYRPSFVFFWSLFLWWWNVSCRMLLLCPSVTRALVIFSFGHCLLPGSPCRVPTRISCEASETSKGEPCCRPMESSLPYKERRCEGQEWEMKHPFGCSKSKWAREADSLAPERLPCQRTELRVSGSCSC